MCAAICWAAICWAVICWTRIADWRQQMEQLRGLSRALPLSCAACIPLQDPEALRADPAAGSAGPSVYPHLLETLHSASLAAQARSMRLQAAIEPQEAVSCDVGTPAQLSLALRAWIDPTVEVFIRSGDDIPLSEPDKGAADGTPAHDSATAASLVEPDTTSIDGGACSASRASTKSVQHSSHQDPSVIRLPMYAGQSGEHHERMGGKAEGEDSAGAGGEQTWPMAPVHVAFTTFFLDVVPDAEVLIRRIRELLLPGGVWVNHGYVRSV